jgi:hypothetical protein
MIPRSPSVSGLLEFKRSADLSGVHRPSIVLMPPGHRTPSMGLDHLDQLCHLISICPLALLRLVHTISDSCQSPSLASNERGRKNEWFWCWQVPTCRRRVRSWRSPCDRSSSNSRTGLLMTLHANLSSKAPSCVCSRDIGGDEAPQRAGRGRSKLHFLLKSYKECGFK